MKDFSKINIKVEPGMAFGVYMEKSELPWEWNFFIVIGVYPVELLAYQGSMLCVANWPR